MSDSLDTSNELEKFDGWEKNTSSIDDLSFDSESTFTDSLDLPNFDENLDFSDTDFDIFGSNPIENELTTDSEDTTLTTDELSNLTNGIESITEETINTSDDSISDFDIPDFESISNVLDEPLTPEDTVEVESSVSDEDFSFDTISDEITNDEFNVEDNNIDEEIPTGEESISDSFELDDNLDVENISIDDPVESTDNNSEFEEINKEINIEESAFENNENVEENFDDNFAQLSENNSTEEISLDDMMSDSNIDEEISIDDFMENGFSDESVASGNNGFEPGKEPQANTSSEEISLDDFFDGEFSMDEPQQETTVVDEKPLDMDINFDPSADSVETEANNSVQMEYEEDDDDSDETDSNVLSEQTEETSTTEINVDSFDAEEIDLSDFGIDENAEETPVTQDVESEKNKEHVVDYDLSVQNEVTSSAPVVNEVKVASETVEDNFVEQNQEPVSSNNQNVTVIDSTVLQKFVDELSSMKAEINSLKSQLAEKQKENEIIPPSAEVYSEENDQIQIEDSIDNEGGFFSADDGDDTIALSTDELSNIMNNASFTEETSTEINSDETISNENETSQDDTIISETSDNEIQNEFIEENQINSEIDVVENNFEIDETSVSSEEVEESTSENNILEPLAATSVGIGLAAVTANLFNNENNTQSTESFVSDTFVSENSEPVENSFDITANDDTVIIDEPLVDSGDLETDVTFEETSVSESVDEPESYDEPVLNNEEESIIEETAVESSFDSVISEEEPVIEETSVESPFDSVTSKEEPVIEETSNIIDNSFASVDDDFTFDSVENDFESFDENQVDDTSGNIEEDSFDTQESILQDTESFEFDEEIEESEIEPEVEESINIDTNDNDFTFDSADEELENMTFESQEDSIIDEDLPEEISIPKDSSFYVDEEVPTVSSIIEESKSSEEEETPVQDETQIFEDVFDTPESFDNNSEESIDDFQFDSIIDSVEETENLEPTTLSSTNIILTNENETFEETCISEEEPVVVEEEATVVEEEPFVVEENSSEVISNDVSFDDDFLVDEDNNDLSDSNINYLTTEDVIDEKVTPINETKSEDNNDELKEDIKSVLRYMDQLLENLPEEKIIEFAKSKEYTTYQKLFSELGLL